MKKMNPLNVILSFAKIGTIGFGGGAALIPIIESEIVEKNKWMQKEEYDMSVAVASISPASLPVSICTIWNLRYSLLSAYFYALPGPVLFMLLLTGFSFIGEAGVRYIEYASAGILIFVMFCIYRFVSKNFTYYIKTGAKAKYLTIFGVSFLLYSGNHVRSLISTLFLIDASHLPVSIFAITMLDLILTLFFIVCFVGVSKSKLKFGIAFLLAILFALSSGRMGILSSFRVPLMIAMAVMAITSIIFDVVKKRNTPKPAKTKINYIPFRNIGFFLILSLILISVTFFISGEMAVWSYALQGITSALTSFGGGEVYYAIAYETFVLTGFISEEIYLSRILGIAGAMPGPVIVSILAGVGFAYGSEAGGVGLGWMFGIVGASMAITATALGALTLFAVFEILKESPRLKMIIQYIMPIVCGVLISVAIQLLNRTSQIIASVGIPSLLSIAIIIIIFFLMVLINKKYQVNDMLLFLLGGTITLAGLSLA